MTTRSCFAVFHMNLAFSAIAEHDQPEVIQSCYHPLLDLVEHSGLPLGIECNGWSLERINTLDPSWINRFARLLKADSCELVGSGYVQMIGPLVPHVVNAWNLRLGQDIYRELLGVQPQLALVNEMAFSPGLVPLYAAHYKAILMERENVALALGGALPHGDSFAAQAPDGTDIPVLWSDSILFQKFQRVVHGDLSTDDYFAWLNKHKHELPGAVPIYCGDTEIFDYRPGRYHYERPGHDEWVRMADFFSQLATRFSICLPSSQVPRHSQTVPLRLNSISHPVPVKKQPKYNVARWAVSGRDDLMLNSLCYRLYKHLVTQVEPDPALIRQLCAFWASDLRTHIHHQRWQRMMIQLHRVFAQIGLPTHFEATQTMPSSLKNSGLITSKDGLLVIETPNIYMEIMPRRGLAINTLSFVEHGHEPLIGTLPHGYFKVIELGADFYSGHCLIEMPGQNLRLTDLEPAQPKWAELDDQLVIRGMVNTPLGKIIKTITVATRSSQVTIRYDFPGWRRPKGIVRVGHVTLMPESWQGQLWLRTRNGGEDWEHFPIDQPCGHQGAISSLISCTTGFGATTGELVLGDNKRGIGLRWDPSACAVFTMLQHEPASPSHLTRIIFSLAEKDDTRTVGGHLPAFSFDIFPLVQQSLDHNNRL